MGQWFTPGEAYNVPATVAFVGGSDYGGTPKGYLPKIDSSGNLYVVAASTPASGALTNRSGVIASGATAQSLMAANASRKYLFIENLDQSEDLWINFTTTAVASQPSILIKPNGSFVMESSFVSTEAISVIAATTNHAYAAKEG